MDNDNLDSHNRPAPAPQHTDASTFSVSPSSVSPSSGATVSGAPGAGPARSAARGRLVRAIAVFSLLRFGLLAVLTAVLVPFMPLLIALAIAIIIQLPLSMVLFPRQRAELLAALADSRAGRRAERAHLRSALRGE